MFALPTGHPKATLQQDARTGVVDVYGGLLALGNPQVGYSGVCASGQLQDGVPHLGVLRKEVTRIRDALRGDDLPVGPRVPDNRGAVE